MTQKYVEDPKNAGLEYMGYPLSHDSVFLDGCQVIRPQLSIYSKCGYFVAYIKRWTSGSGQCQEVTPKMYARKISPDELWTLPETAIRV